jgi:hypothetical protein
MKFLFFKRHWDLIILLILPLELYLVPKISKFYPWEFRLFLGSMFVQTLVVCSVFIGVSIYRTKLHNISYKRHVFSAIVICIWILILASQASFLML